MNRITRGELAKQAGVGIEAIRFYEKKALIPKPRRNESGYREYSPEDVKQIRFIKRAQELGFTLKEIKNLVELQATSKAMCADVQKRADKKYAEIEKRISDLKRMLRSLREISNCCSKGEPTRNNCSILECFEGGCECS